MDKSLSYLRKMTAAKGLIIENIVQKINNIAYEGLCFDILNISYRSRLAKKTAKKAGYFTVFWEKDKEGKNSPYHFESSPDQLIIVVLDSDRKGKFVFPRDVLLEHGILADDLNKGKMALRVYPDWESDLNATAQKTQSWQIDYFVNNSS